MTTFLFWNINRNPIENIVANLAFEHEIDILVLTECEISVDVMLKTLNQREANYHFPFSLCEKIAVYTKFSRDFLQPVNEGNRFTIRRLSLPARVDILLAAVHIQSKLHVSETDQTIECMNLSRIIQEEESKVGHARTVLVGDFNLNPFETGVIAAAGLNATRNRQIAFRHTRVIQDQPHPFFYNPMWSHFVEREGQPAGTYYYSGSEQVTYFWNIFDQVLLRPDLIQLFHNEDLKILGGYGTTSFLTRRGLPKSIISDHLPILFELKL